MDKLVGVRWGDLSEETKEFLLMNSNIWDNVKEGEGKRQEILITNY